MAHCSNFLRPSIPIIAAALALLFFPQASAAETFVLPRAISLEPPTNCANPFPNTDRVWVVETRRIKLVLDRTNGTYQAWTGRCGQPGEGIEDHALVPAGNVEGLIPWTTTDRVLLEGQARLPGGFSLIPAPMTLKGPDPAPALVVPLETASDGNSRTGRADQSFNFKVDSKTRKIEFHLRSVRVTITRDGGEIATANIFEIVYGIDPHIPPTEGCPPQSFATGEVLTVPPVRRCGSMGTTVVNLSFAGPGKVCNEEQNGAWTRHSCHQGQSSADLIPG